jgi:hypothetical protein
MATRSTIALEYADGTVQQIYCHWDGDLDGVGLALSANYSDPFKLDELIAQGDTGTIGDPFTHRGEELNIRYYASFADYVNTCQSEEYDYILRQVDGQAVWFVRCEETKDQWVPFDQVYAMETGVSDEDWADG